MSFKDILYSGSPDDLRRNHYYDYKNRRWIERDTPEYYACLRRNEAEADIDRRVDRFYAQRRAELHAEFITQEVKRGNRFPDDQQFAQWLREPGSGGTGPEEKTTYVMETGFSGEGPLVEDTVRRHYDRSQRLAYECRQYRRQLEGKAADDLDPKPRGGRDATSDGVEYKSVLSAVASVSTGLITGYASTWDTKDLVGDRVVRGAFSACLRRRRKDGRPFPILFGHDTNRPIGKIEVHDISEDDSGLLFKGRIDASTPDGQWALSGIKEGYLAFASIGFRVLDEEYDRNGVRLLKQIELYEVSCTPLPAQPEARIRVIN